jgi:hypothetical protein
MSKCKSKESANLKEGRTNVGGVSKAESRHCDCEELRGTKQSRKQSRKGW